MFNKSIICQSDEPFKPCAHLILYATKETTSDELPLSRSKSVKYIAIVIGEAGIDVPLLAVMKTLQFRR